MHAGSTKRLRAGHCMFSKEAWKTQRVYHAFCFARQPWKSGKRQESQQNDFSTLPQLLEMWTAPTRKQVSLSTLPQNDYYCIKNVKA